MCVSAAEPLVQIDGKPSCCFFKFSPKLMFTKVLKAQLWVYLRPLQQTSTVYLQILRLKPVTEQGSRHIRIRSQKIELNSRVGHWKSIDFKHVLQNWFKQPHTNWGIDINAFDESGHDLAVTSLRPGEEGLVRTSDLAQGVGGRGTGLDLRPDPGCRGGGTGLDLRPDPGCRGTGVWPSDLAQGFSRVWLRPQTWPRV